jgi:hypothetical protein
MGQGMSVFVVFSCETLDVVVAGLDWALFWALILVSEHMRLQILENFSALWICAAALLTLFLAAVVAILTTAGRVRY